MILVYLCLLAEHARAMGGGFICQPTPGDHEDGQLRGQGGGGKGSHPPTQGRRPA